MLRPLAARYGRWLGLERAEVEQDREEAAQDIRAMQILLRMERAAPPSWHIALGLAATGAAALCLDERAEPAGEWHEEISDYCRGHIRKVVRRGRGAQWEATAEVPGLTFVEGDTQVRVLVPGRAVDLDKRVSKLQVGGTDVEPDPAPPVPPPPVLRVRLTPEPVMTRGKAMAQAGHAGMIAAALLAGSDQDTLARWRDAGCTVAADRADSGVWRGLLGELDDPERAWTRNRLLAVRDAGFTEVAPGTVTMIATVES